MEQSNNKGLEGYRNTFPNNYLYELGSGDKSTATNDSSLEEYALLSFFGRINYAWKDRYLLEVNLRYDGSSRFADGHRWGLFPSVSAGWRISEEDFWKNAADVVLMKSRLSDVPAAIRLSRFTLRNIHENLFWAFIYNIIGIPLAAGVWIPIFGWTLNTMFGALAMSLSSFCVVTNALRLNFVNIKKCK